MVYITILSSDGQITIPHEVRDELGLKPDDKIEILIDGEGGARLRKAGPSLEDVVGIFPALNAPEEESEWRTNEELAGHYAEKYQ